MPVSPPCTPLSHATATSFYSTEPTSAHLKSTAPNDGMTQTSAGSSVMLPLTAADGFSKVEVLVCGGAQPNCMLNPAPAPAASQTCGRIMLTATNPSWAMEDMPTPRTMGDMLFLANGDVIIINGAQNGCQGWGNAKNAALSPVVYKPAAAAGLRFVTQNPTTIPRVYHSTANLLPDGRVLVAGSNTHQFYTFTGVFPTELRVEAFSPSYLDTVNDVFRPTIATAPKKIAYGKKFNISVTVATSGGRANFRVSLVSSPFTTHSYSQGLRFLRLAVKTLTASSAGNNRTLYVLSVVPPPNANLAPSSYYMLFVENKGIPSAAAWVQLVATRQKAAP